MVKRFACAAVCVLAATTMAYAGSVDTFGIGSRATALGGAYAATADDPFAVYYNPAGLSQIEGKIFAIGAHAVDPTIKMSDYTAKSATNGSVLYPATDFEDESDILIAPHMGYAQKIGDRFAIGVAAYAPWGMELEWEKDPAKSPGTYSAYHSYYKRYGVTPSLSYKVSDKLAFGVGVTIGRSEAGAETTKYLSDVSTYLIDTDGDESTAKVAFGTVVQGMLDTAKVLSGSPVDLNTTTAKTVYETAYTNYKAAYDAGLVSDAKKLSNLKTAYGIMTALSNPAKKYDTAADLVGADGDLHNSTISMELQDDVNYSYNVGVMYKPKETITIGLTYRSECEADFEGDVMLNGVKKSDVTMNYNHPQQLQAGVRYQPHDKFSIECDVVWTDWSVNKEQLTVIETGLPVTLINGIPSSVSEEDFSRKWEDTKQLRFGMEYKVSDMITVRGGYFYDPTPIPDNTLDMQWPDADKKTYSLGAGFNFGRYTIDVVTQYIDIEKARQIGGESVNLNNSFQGNVVSASADGYILGAGVTLTARF